MDAQSLWLVILSVATPIAGVVGFAIQLREVKKTRLENEKLQLEIEALRANASQSERRVVQVTTDEVLRFSMPHASTPRHDMPLPSAPFTGFLARILTAVGLLLLAAYFVYDGYRLIMWLVAKL
jgi:hypothetical protein